MYFYKGVFKTKISLIFSYLHIYKILKHHPYRLFKSLFLWDRRGGVFVFSTYSFSLLIFGGGYIRKFGFLSYRGNFVGLSIPILFRKGSRLKPPFHPFREGIAALNTSKWPILTKWFRNNNFLYQNDNKKIGFSKLFSL